ncbi:MAG TPA: biopolymer transporter ExbD, partial [Mucilaginibacter sp.]
GLRTAIIETGKRVQAATGKSMIVLIKPAEHSVYANLVDALDEVNITKVQTYAIVDISKTDIDLLKQKGMY